ncbi:methyltransferase domain-containing protein [Dyella solisilvae]|uniref:Methyltransferase domain-containing protein n=1 Tax=Dyella solisilvae TaxID=1920168 RepID=A0A370K364_9GAMM|nr:methyltransferase domain-containing protein [Dyella solisilvae]RDI97082.1 methyltransferase domain-containing protein [Dyella solisilvae]
MSQRDQDIYTSGPLRSLLAEETVALAPELQRCAGTHALLLSAAREDVPPVLPLLANWTRLNIDGGAYAGDVRASGHDPLPFVDDAFDLVLLRHALEVSTAPHELLEEASRVLAPGGVLALTGLHPFSAWLPWMVWRTGGRTPAVHSPILLERWVRRIELDIERVERVGQLWPSAYAGLHAAHAFGGGYLLIARKRRRMATPIRLKPKPAPAPVNVGLAPGVRRSAAS